MIGGEIRTGFVARLRSRLNGEYFRTGQAGLGVTTGVGTFTSRVAVLAGVAQRCAGFAVSDKFDVSFTTA